MFKHINIQQLIKKINTQNVNIFDIRDRQSFSAGHIPHAAHLDNENINSFIKSTQKNEVIVVCCYHGNSSQGAAQYFFEQGFQEAFSLDGGFEAWKLSQPDNIEIK